MRRERPPIAVPGRGRSPLVLGGVVAALAFLLGSCSPPAIIAKAVFLGSALAFVSEGGDDDDLTYCWSEAAVVDDSGRPAWRFSGEFGGGCGKTFPLFYGEAPNGAEVEVPAAKLAPGRLYVLVGRTMAEVDGAFWLTRAGASTVIHNLDPSDSAAQAAREAFWRSERSDPPVPAVEDASL